MDAKNLIQNLIDAIDALPTDGIRALPSAVYSSIEDAKETASLAKLVLPTIVTTSPVAAKVWVVHDEDMGEVFGPFGSEAEAEAVERQLDAQGSSAGRYEVTAPKTGATPPSASLGICGTCRTPLDANGCPDPNCPSHAVNGPAPQTYQDVLDDLHDTVQGRHRPGSTIANKPPGSLYSN